MISAIVGGYFVTVLDTLSDIQLIILKLKFSTTSIYKISKLESCLFHVLIPHRERKREGEEKNV